MKEAKATEETVRKPAAPPPNVTGKTAPKCSQAKTGTQPTGAKALVRQLGDTNFEKREAAYEALARMGKQALPALEAGTNLLDPEISERCARLVARIKVVEAEPEVPEIPKGLRKSFRQIWNSVWRGGHGPGAVVTQLKIRGGPGVKIGETRTTGRDSRQMSNSAGSVAITVTSNGGISLVVKPKGGKPVTRSYQAASREEFREKYPKFTAKYLE